MQPLFLRHKKFTILISILIIADILFYLFGILAPFITLKKFFIFDKTVSLLESIQILYIQKQTALAIIVSLFSVVFPLLKLILLAAIWFLIKDDHKIKKWLFRIEVVGNWSMLDVFVIAITIVAIKLSGLGSMKVEYGLYLFALSVILTKITLVMINRLVLKKTS
jgi:paraquat-inducible protein A